MNTNQWGCHNRDIAPGYWHGMTWIPHNMSKDCRSDSANDPRCSGCKWQRKEADPAPMDGTGGLR